MWRSTVKGTTRKTQNGSGRGDRSPENGSVHICAEMNESITNGDLDIASIVNEFFMRIQRLNNSAELGALMFAVKRSIQESPMAECLFIPIRTVVVIIDVVRGRNCTA
jgi:hypothetical protein